MLYSYFKIAFRNLFRSGRSAFYAWINISGLTIGLIAFLLIGHYISHELRFDLFFPNQHNLYRLVVERQESGESTMHSAKTYPGIGQVLTGEIPEVEQVVRILDEECMFRYEAKNITINRQRTFWADGNFPELFGLELVVEGQPEMLNNPHQAVISRTAAERFFGTDWSGESSPIGKTLFLNEHIPFLIQGVFEDLPPHSHMKVDVVVSYSTLMAVVGEFMHTIMPPQNNFVYNYLMLAEGSGANQIESSINETIARHSGEMEEQVSYHFSLQPVSTIHLNSHLSDELNPNSNQLFIVALAIAAVLIIVVAWINFINLTLARAMNRSREVGVRKVVGARRAQLGLQFTVETLVSGTIAMLLSLLILLIGHGYFNQMTGITLPLFSTENGQLWLVFLCTFLTGVIIASAYPALVMSSFNPIRALKGKNAVATGSSHFRQSLITFQFCIALLLISCTGAIYYQVDSMRNQYPGADFSQVLVVHSPRSMIGNTDRSLHFERFRDVLETNSGIVSIASGGCLPGENFLYHTEEIRLEGVEKTVNWSFDLASVDEHYLPTLGVTMIGGRNFERRSDEKNKVILNETAIKALGLSDAAEAIGKSIRINDNESKEIIGVVADVHYEGLQKPIKPLLLKYGHDYEFGFFPIKIRTRDLREAISLIETQWNTSYPKDPFDYFFLDQFFDRQYKNDKAFGQLFGSFSLLTIFIAGLGLFGLMSFTTYQKSKEIAIRKVLGASALTIFRLLTMGFVKLMALAALIALPIAYLIINHWLETFAYRFEPSLLMYLIPLVVLAVTALISVGGQTIKAAVSNPVNAIADE